MPSQRSPDARIALLTQRLDTVEKRTEEHAEFAHALADLLTEARIELAKITTTIRIWGSIVLVGTPLLAAFGAWIVVRNTTPPAASPTPALHVAVEPVEDLPEIEIATKGPP